MVKDKIAIDKMRTAGKLLAQILEKVRSLVVEGANTWDLDRVIEADMRFAGLKPECKGYAGYKYATCISLNDVIVHGVPSKEIVLKSGDFVKIDVVGSYQGYCADLSRYVFVGQANPVALKLAKVAQQALDAAIDLAIPGNKVSDISARIQQIVESSGFSVIRKFAGHGIGRTMHEEPDIPNYVHPGCGFLLKPGMTLAIEPMIAENGFHVKTMSDGWTAKTLDGGLAAHVEDTVLITDGVAEVLTR
jgi:methionyl aminopeptidase